ncbi:Hypothetical predicted protein [Pelobates cultripes]|uniref:Uncharacterized protein n=1 Tax=Pelobates cultripes TaxID=61616 RepID=A0AAD1RP95_PELCU|nr:Hypothetical predicted protein [Pelobates cultripes]
MDTDPLMDHAHRVRKPRSLTADITRDIVVKMHYFYVKEALLQIHRKAQDLPVEYQNIAIFPDLTAATMPKRWKFINVTKILRNHKIVL